MFKQLWIKLKNLNNNFGIETMLTVAILVAVLTISVFEGVSFFLENRNKESRLVEQSSLIIQNDNLHKNNTTEKVINSETSPIPTKQDNQPTNNSNQEKPKLEPSTQGKVLNLPKVVEYYVECQDCLTSKSLLNEIQEEYKDKLIVEYIDISKKDNYMASKKYDVLAIPTQIIFDSKGVEIHRHKGIFITKKDILRILEDLDIITIEHPIP